jgi:hypothetical protein
MLFTEINIEQSLAKYLSEKFAAEDYRTHWWDTNVTSGEGSKQITIIRNIPEDPAYLVLPQTQQAAPLPEVQQRLVPVPLLSATVGSSPKTELSRRMGIGEGVFEWLAEVRIEGFASSELEWYRLLAWFKVWLMHPDTRIEVRDYERDLTDPDPDPTGEYLWFRDCDLVKQELPTGLPDAARYYVQFGASARFID